MIATGFSFAVFGIGGVVIALTGAFLVFITTRDELQRESRCRKIYSASFRLYIKMMRFLGLLTYEVEGLDKLEPGSLIIANHPSLLDVVFLISLVPETNCIVKGALFHNFFTLLPIRVCGYLDNDAESLLEDCVRALDTKRGLLIFPQGTRTSQSAPVKFRRGAANIALSSEAGVCLAILTCRPETLRKNERWYQVPSSPPHFTFSFHKFEDIEHFRALEEPQSLRARKLTRSLEAAVSYHLKPTS